MSDRETFPFGAGWADRLLSTGKVGFSAARLAARRVLGMEGDADGAIGEALASELDRMKGMAMKVGQILSYFDGVLPEETHAALRVLQQGAASMAWDKVAAVIRRALGSDPDDLFDSIDRAPVAGASIGQVHRAVYRGAPVAVKVQYPGIVDTISTDLARVRGFSHIASLGTAVDGPAIADELAERVRAECDYNAEARWQELFRRAFASSSDVVIPSTVPERTAETVLTMAWCEGRDFYTFARDASQEARDAAGMVLLRFAHRSFFTLGMVNADPHPGNYVFLDDGRVAFLDFGCVRRFDPPFVDAERRLARIVLEGDRGAFPEAVLATGMVADPRKFDYDLHWKVMRHQYAPFIADAFTFSLEHVRAGMELNTPANPNLRRLAIPPQWIWLQRLQWGLLAVLARLGVHGSFGPMLREILDAPSASTSTDESPVARQP
jgi:predicted unusual protein kinase regulating ubiquinone biosynthesis (AarF/ABC1/UbiB family)